MLFYNQSIACNLYKRRTSYTKYHCYGCAQCNYYKYILTSFTAKFRRKTTINLLRAKIYKEFLRAESIFPKFVFSIKLSFGFCVSFLIAFLNVIELRIII